MIAKLIQWFRREPQIDLVLLVATYSERPLQVPVTYLADLSRL